MSGVVLEGEEEAEDVEGLLAEEEDEEDGDDLQLEPGRSGGFRRGIGGGGTGGGSSNRVKNVFSRRRRRLVRGAGGPYTVVRSGGTLGDLLMVATLCSAFFCIGFTKSLLDESFSSVGIVSQRQSASAVGNLAGYIIGGFLLASFSRLFIVLLSTLVLGVTLTFVPWTTSLWAIDAVYTVIGITLAVLMTGGTVIVLDQWGRRCGPHIQAIHFCLSLGMLTGPFLVDPLSQTHVPKVVQHVLHKQGLVSNNDTTTEANFSPKYSVSLLRSKREQDPLLASIFDVAETSTPRPKPSFNDGTKLDNSIDWEKVKVAKPTREEEEEMETAVKDHEEEEPTIDEIFSEIEEDKEVPNTKDLGKEEVVVNSPEAHAISNGVEKNRDNDELSEIFDLIQTRESTTAVNAIQDQIRKIDEELGQSDEIMYILYGRDKRSPGGGRSRIGIGRRNDFGKFPDLYGQRRRMPLPQDQPVWPGPYDTDYYELGRQPSFGEYEDDPALENVKEIDEILAKHGFIRAENGTDKRKNDDDGVKQATRTVTSSIFTSTTAAATTETTTVATVKTTTTMITQKNNSFRVDLNSGKDSSVQQERKKKPTTLFNNETIMSGSTLTIQNILENYGVSKPKVGFILDAIYAIGLSFVLVICLCYSPREPRSRQEMHEDDQFITSSSKSLTLMLSLLLYLFTLFHWGMFTSVHEIISRMQAMMGGTTPNAQQVFMATFTLTRLALVLVSAVFSYSGIILFLSLAVIFGGSLAMVFYVRIDTGAVWVGLVVQALGLAGLLPASVIWAESYMAMTPKTVAFLCSGMAGAELVVPHIFARLDIQPEAWMSFAMLGFTTLSLCLFVLAFLTAKKKGTKNGRPQSAGYELANQEDLNQELLEDQDDDFEVAESTLRLKPVVDDA